MYYINNADMICIPFTLEHLEHARNIASNAVITFGVIMGLIVSSMALFATSMVRNISLLAQNVLSNMSSEEIICIAFAITTLMFTLILKVNAMLLDDIFKKVLYLTKENDLKSAKIEMLSGQMDSYWEKITKTA